MARRPTRSHSSVARSLSADLCSRFLCQISLVGGEVSVSRWRDVVDPTGLESLVTRRGGCTIGEGGSGWSKTKWPFPYGLAALHSLLPLWHVDDASKEEATESIDGFLVQVEFLDPPPCLPALPPPSQAIGVLEGR